MSRCRQAHTLTSEMDPTPERHGLQTRAPHMNYMQSFKKNPTYLLREAAVSLVMSMFTLSSFSILSSNCILTYMDHCH